MQADNLRAVSLVLSLSFHFTTRQTARKLRLTEALGKSKVRIAVRESIDFTKYTLKELHESARSIDREKFPERAARIDALIQTKEGHLPSSVAGRYYYKKNYLNLVNGYLLVCFVVVILYFLFNGSNPVASLRFLEYTFLVCSAVLLLFAAYRFFKAYVKLDGRKRFIQIGSRTVLMPEHSNSVKYVEFPVSEINEVYYRVIRRTGIVGGLVIIYDYDKSATISIEYLSVRDFESVCTLLIEVANLENIAEKYT